MCWLIIFLRRGRFVYVIVGVLLILTLDGARYWIPRRVLRAVAMLPSRDWFWVSPVSRGPKRGSTNAAATSFFKFVVAVPALSNIVC